MHCIWFIPISCSVYRESKSKSGAGRNASQKLAGTLSCHHFRSLMGASVFAERSVLVQLVDSECLPRGPPTPRYPHPPFQVAMGGSQSLLSYALSPSFNGLSSPQHTTHTEHTHTLAEWRQPTVAQSSLICPKNPPFWRGLHHPRPLVMRFLAPPTLWTDSGPFDGRNPSPC